MRPMNAVDILLAGAKRAALILSLVIVPCVSHAQDKASWHNKECAVCLTYDDALNVHLDKVVPALDSLGLRGTFYISGFFPAFAARSAEWKSVASKGHELGNHTLFHPCDGRLPGRDWVKRDYDLSNYSIQRMVDEITMANILLNAIDGRTKRTFAYPCGDTKAGDSSYVARMAEGFVGARGVQGRMERLGEIDLSDIGAYMISGQSGDELVGLVKKAMESKALIVFLFHGVGGEHSLNVTLEAHDRLLQYLKANEDRIWVAPLAEIAEYVKQSGQQKR
jgi:peptidoglycan/xylan/chitin deacetylase (PgdA/CDA1 family)